MMNKREKKMKNKTEWALVSKPVFPSASVAELVKNLPAMWET